MRTQTIYGTTVDVLRVSAPGNNAQTAKYEIVNVCEGGDCDDETVFEVNGSFLVGIEAYVPKSAVHAQYVVDIHFLNKDNDIDHEALEQKIKQVINDHMGTEARVDYVTFEHQYSTISTPTGE